jgi:hypothetical protein
LDEQTKNFLDNAEKGLKIETDSLRVSQIFDWYDEDFAVKGVIKMFIKN